MLNCMRREGRAARRKPRAGRRAALFSSSLGRLEPPEICEASMLAAGLAGLCFTRISAFRKLKSI